MKKLLSILCAFAVVLSFTSCSSTKEETGENEQSTATAEATAAATTQGLTGSTSSALTTDSTSQNGQEVEIVEEYIYNTDYSNYHFVVVKNNTANTLSVSTSSIAYDANGTVLGADDGSLNALGAGCTSIIWEMFDIDGEIASCTTQISSSESRYYESVIQDLTYTQTDISNGAVFQITNNGTDAAEFVEGYALFLKDGAVVDWDYAYFTDNDNEIKPGATLAEQLDTREEFDTILFYMDGRKSD